MSALFALTPAVQRRKQHEYAARMRAQADCLEHHRALIERLARMSVEERRICYGLPPAPARRLKTLPGMKTLTHTMQAHLAAHAAARADARWAQTVREHMHEPVHEQAHGGPHDDAPEPVPEIPRVITATWRALWLTGRSLALTFSGRAAV